LKYGATWQAASDVVAGSEVVAAAEVTTVVENTDELEELEEVVVGWTIGGGYSTAYKVTTLQVEPRLYWNLDVNTARTPLQSANTSVDYSKLTKIGRAIPDAMAAPSNSKG
jgi:hypothetical protein